MNKGKVKRGRPELYDEKKTRERLYIKPQVKEKLTQVYGNISKALDALYGDVIAQEEQEKLNRFKQQ